MPIAPRSKSTSQERCAVEGCIAARLMTAHGMCASLVGPAGRRRELVKMDGAISLLCRHVPPRELGKREVRPRADMAGSGRTLGQPLPSTPRAPHQQLHRLLALGSSERARSMRSSPESMRSRAISNCTLTRGPARIESEEEEEPPELLGEASP